MLATLVDTFIQRSDGRKGRRPAYPTEVMVRVLVLKRLYNLSDEQMEFQLLDRMSYQRFCLLQDSMNVPDRNTIWRFVECNGLAARRGRTICTGTATLPEVDRPLRRRWYPLPAGASARTIEANSRKKTGGPTGAVPKAAKNTDATPTKKHGKRYFGYKLGAIS